MTRWLLLIIPGLLLGGIVHLVSLLMLPSLASGDAYSRLLASTAENKIELLPQPTPEKSIFSFMDPAFAVAVCRFNLTEGPLRLQMLVSPAYSAASFYTRTGIAFYAINDRAGGRRVIDLELVNAEQRAEISDEDEVTGPDRLIVEAPTDTGLILLRALATEPGEMPAMRGLLSGARCERQAPPRTQ